MKVHEIAKLVEGVLDGDGETEIRGIAGLDRATGGQIAFAEGTQGLGQAVRSGAGCIIVPSGQRVAGHTTIAVARPKLALIRVAAAILPPPAVAPGIHPTAVVSPDAEVAGGASVGPNAVIEKSAKIGVGTSIGAGSFVGEGVEIGTECTLHPHVSIYPGARIGNRVILHSGVVIGGDGFGYIFVEGRHQKFPQIGQVRIEDDVEVGCNTTIDRGSLGETVIGQGTKIDNLVQIAHNVRIGRHCIIVSQTGISGSSEIGDHVVIGGQVGIGEHVRIEDQVRVGGQAGILPGKVIKKGMVVWGTPARPFEQFKTIHAYLSRLPELAEKLREISRRMARDENQEK
ncbi:MAG TPA: UDP-3-O-(3-hydroxymyristoyl)glucosamine N-acyltransferase [Terriglobia bacterium]|nr:UDP-3-O-(3-hydroxymyristoyl)glucosamine N-acyltransferase [Terriglobia bacterium]